MEIISDLRARVAGVKEGIETGELVRDVLVNHQRDILDLQKRQLFAGLASDGQDLRPYYTEDLKPTGYFHSVEAAKRYAAWKTGLNYPYSANRNPNAPNLYVNGKFHDELGVQFEPQTVGIIGTTGYAKEIVEKYGLEKFGLTAANWAAIFSDMGAYNELMNNIRAKLYGN